MPRPFIWEKRIISSTNGTGTINIQHAKKKKKKKKLDLYLTSYTYINSKRMRELNIRAKTLNIFGSLCDLELGNSFLDVTPKNTNQTKNRLIGVPHRNPQNKKTCTSKDTIKKVNRELTGENYLQIIYLIRACA